jgi:glycosyltransferase involved in cell wall biosynthesis
MQTIRCIQRADRIITLNPADVGCLKFLVKDSDKIALIKPFLGEIPVPPHGIADASADAGEHRSLLASKMSGHKTVTLITVAMMREGDKKASYWLLSQALRSLDTTNWKLIIIGGGNAATEIRQFFNNLSGECIFTGEIDNREIFNYLAKADIFVWPAVNEALGLAILEAQAYGLPAVVQNYGGVSTIIEHQVTGYVTDPDDFGTFVSALKILMHDGHKRHCMSRAAKRKFESEHSFRSALRRLKAILDKLEYH